MKKEYYEQKKKEAEDILNKKAEGVAVREIMAGIYVDRLPNKSKEQGLMMANKAMDSILDFKKDFEETIKNKDTAFEKICERMLEGKNLTERCNSLNGLYMGAEAAKAKLQGEKDYEDILLQADCELITEEEATEALEAELKEKVFSSFSEMSVLSRGMIRQAEQIEALTQEQGISEMVVQIGEEEAEYEGILTMLVYADSKTTDMQEIPPDLTIEEIAYIVCATVEEQLIIKRYTAGEITMAVATALLDALGFVLMVKLGFSIIMLGVKIATAMCGMMAALPAMIFMTVGIMGIMGKTFKVWTNGVKFLMDMVVTVKTRVVSVAMRKMGDFINSTIIPISMGIVQKVKDFWARIKNKNDIETNVQTTI